MTRGGIRRIALALALLVPVAVEAQLPTLPPGLRVRANARPTIQRRVIGAVMSQTVDTVTLASSAATWHRIPAAAVVAIDVHKGESRLLGLMRGLLIGTAVIGGGAMIGSWSATDNNFVAPIALTGAGVGALIGVFVPADRWHRVYARPLWP